MYLHDFIHCATCLGSWIIGILNKVTVQVIKNVHFSTDMGLE